MARNPNNNFINSIEIESPCVSLFVDGIEDVRTGFDELEPASNPSLADHLQELQSVKTEAYNTLIPEDTKKIAIKNLVRSIDSKLVNLAANRNGALSEELLTSLNHFRLVGILKAEYGNSYSPPMALYKGEIEKDLCNKYDSSSPEQIESIFYASLPSFCFESLLNCFDESKKSSDNSVRNYFENNAQKDLESVEFLEPDNYVEQLGNNGIAVARLACTLDYRLPNYIDSLGPKESNIIRRLSKRIIYHSNKSDAVLKLEYGDKGFDSSEANCKGQTSTMYPRRGTETNTAKRICRNCDLQSECLEASLEPYKQYGIWGGKSSRERIELKKLRRIAQLNSKTPE